MTDSPSSPSSPSSPPIVAPSRPAPSPALPWSALISYLREWFALPDDAIESLKIVFLACLVHAIPECEPVWCMIIGAPGSGKTSVAIRCMSAFPGAYVMSGISENTLISSFGRGLKQRKESSLLYRLGPAPRILIKDFTTLLSKREHVREEVFSQLRELHDGALRNDKGNGASFAWEGKATVMAACTPAVERKWDAMRELGERFMIVRWPKADPFEAGRLSRRQNQRGVSGSGAMAIKAEQLRLTAGLISAFQGRLDSPPAPSDHDGERFDALAEVVARCRAQVVRDSHGKRNVIEVCDHESNSRVSAALQSIAIGAALLHDSPTLGEREFALVTRLVRDTIPGRRARILAHIPHKGGITREKLKNLLGIPASSLFWNLTEMRYLGLTRTVETLEGTSVALTDSFRALLDLGQLRLSQPSANLVAMTR